MMKEDNDRSNLQIDYEVPLRKSENNNKLNVRTPIKKKANPDFFSIMFVLMNCIACSLKKAKPVCHAYVYPTRQ